MIIKAKPTDVKTHREDSSVLGVCEGLQIDCGIQEGDRIGFSIAPDGDVGIGIYAGLRLLGCVSLCNESAANFFRQAADYIEANRK